MPADPPFEIVDPALLPTLDKLACQRGGIPDLCSVLMPGGAQMSAPDVLDMMQPALAPLAPLFTTLEAVVKVKQCMDATIEAISTLDVAGLIECVRGLAALVDKLLALLPQASIPIMVVNVIDCMIATLNRLLSVLLSLQAQAERIARTLDRAAELNDPKLAFIVACSNDRLGDSVSDEMKGLVALGRMMGIVSGLAEVAGIPLNLPDFEELAALPLDEIIEPIEAAIAALEAARDAIPIP